MPRRGRAPSGRTNSDQNGPLGSLPVWEGVGLPKRRKVATADWASSFPNPHGLSPITWEVQMSEPLSKGDELRECYVCCLKQEMRPRTLGCGEQVHSTPEVR